MAAEEEGRAREAQVPSTVILTLHDFKGEPFDLSEDEKTRLYGDSRLSNSTLWKGKAIFTAPSNIPGADLGLFARISFRTGDHICAYTGELLVTKEAIKRTDKRYLMRLGPQTYVDPLEYPSILARYINDPLNRQLINVEFDKRPDSNCAIVKASRPIEQGNLITTKKAPFSTFLYNYLFFIILIVVQVKNCLPAMVGFTG